MGVAGDYSRCTQCRWTGIKLGLSAALAGSLAEVVAMLVECGAVQMTDKSVASTAGDGNGGGQFTAAAAGSHNSTLASDITFESKTALFQK